MTKQNKGRKFFATAATATLVASAIVPVASAAELNDAAKIPTWAKDAVNYLVTEGAVTGDQNGNFNPSGNLTRAQAAQILSKLLKLDATGTENFNDVKEGDWYYDAAVATSPEIFTGDEKGNFNPNAPLTRQEAAKVIVSAFGLTGTADLSQFADASKVPAWAKSFIETAVANKVINGKNGLLAPTDTITNAEFAVLTKGAVDAATPVDAEVTSVSATNSKTLEITGAALSKLTAEDIKVEGIGVESVTASTDGKTATVKLDAELIVGETTKVTVKEKTFDVSYTVKATGVAVIEGKTYDDDTEDQFVKISVDGKEVTAQELINAGYTVNYEAFTTKAGSTAANIFDGGSNTSTTGELLSPINLVGIADDYYVKVTVTSGSDVMTSAITKITIKNTNIAADNVTEAVLSNITTGADQISSTLVTGETANISEITVKAANTTETLTSGYTVKSSDAAVVSVNNGTLTAQGPGTATLTISYGGTTYTKTITVKSEARKATSVKVGNTAVTVAEGSTATTSVQLLDQYGDPIRITAGNLSVVSSDNTVATADGSLGNGTGNLGISVGSEHKATLTIDGVDAGTAIFTFRNASGAKIGTTSVRATVTDNTAISKYTLTVDNDISSSDLTAIQTTSGVGSLTKNDISTDATIDNGSDAYVKINIKGLNNAGQQVVSSPSATADYQVTAVNTSDANVLDTTTGDNNDGVFAANGYILVKAGTANGTATITVTDRNNANVNQTFKVTVTNQGYTVTGVNFKNVAAPTYGTTLDVKDFLSYTNSANDLIISGLTLSKSVAQAIRLDTNGSTLYVDKDGSGTNTAGDIEVGSLVISTTGSIAANSTNADITDTVTGVAVATGDEGYVILKVLNTGADKVVGGGDDLVVATKAVKIDF